MPKRKYTLTEQQRQFIKDNYGRLSQRKLAAELCVHFGAIKYGVKILGLSSPRPFKRSRTAWTEDEVKILKEFYPVRKNSEVLAMLLPGRTERQMYSKVQVMGIHKDKAFWGQYMRDLYNNLSEEQLEQRKKSQFKKGHATHNKGVKMPQELRDKLSRTWFQKGHNANPNAQFDGAITWRNYSNWGRVQFIRIAKSKWIPLHHYVWQQAGNEVKEGHVIIFIDGDTSNCAIDNLQQITCADNMRRNSIVNYGKEFQSMSLFLAGYRKRLSKFKQQLYKQQDNGIN